MFKKHLPLLAFVTVFVPQFVFTQKYQVRDGVEELSSFTQSVGALGNGDYINVTCDFNKKAEQESITITRYNSQLRKSTAMVIPQLSGKTFRFLYKLDAKWFLAASDQSRKVTQYQVNATGADVQLSDETKLFVQSAETSVYDIGYSPDSSKIILFAKTFEDKKKRPTNIEGVVIDKSNTISRPFSFSVDKSSREIDVQALVTNAGIAAFITGFENDEKGSYRPMAYDLVTITAAGKPNPPIRLSLPEGKATRPVCRINGEQLFYSSLLAKRKEDYTAAITGSFDLATQKQGEVTEQSFLNASYLQGVSKSLEKISRKGIDIEAVHKKAFIFPDGSAIQLLENGDDYTMVSSYANTPNIGNSYSVNYHRLNDIYVVKWNPDGKIGWMKVIRKKQEEPSLMLYTSFSAMKDQNNVIHVFFHDRTENSEVDPDDKITLANVGDIKKHSLAAVAIAKDGKMKKQFILDNEAREFQFSPAKTYFVSGNELFFISLKHKMIGRDLFSVGKISVK